MHNNYFIYYFRNFRAITSRRKERLCRLLLDDESGKIGFVDVGSGLELKAEWKLLPVKRVKKIDFEASSSDETCFTAISDKKGTALFRHARNPRNSSLHAISAMFVERYQRTGMLQEKVTEIRTETLDHLFDSQIHEIDILDINVEGHDLYVLIGSQKILSKGLVKCVKVEFELTEVWKGQGYFSDIDPLLRSFGFELARLDVHNENPSNARHIRPVFQRGEPIWGKAFYVPSLAKWGERIGREVEIIEADLRKAIAIYTVLDIPGRSVDLIDTFGKKFGDRIAWHTIKQGINNVYRYAWLDRAIFRILFMLKSFIRILHK